MKSPVQASEKAEVIYEMPHAADFETDEDAVKGAVKRNGATHYAKMPTGIFAFTPVKDGYECRLVYYFEGKWHITRQAEIVPALPQEAVAIKKKKKKVASEKASDAGSFATVERNVDATLEGKKLGQITGPEDVYALLHDQCSRESQEVFVVIPVNLHGEPLCAPVEVARGQRDRVTVDYSDVLRPVIATNASGFIVAHNHPTGAALPSKADKDLTKGLIKATDTALGSVAFIDHVVIGLGQYYSISEGKLYKV